MSGADLLRELGIPGHYLGYRQLACALDLLAEKEERILNVYRDVYVVVGEHFHTTGGNVEKNIRTVLQAAWQRDYTRHQFERLAGYSSPNRPFASEFLDAVSAYLRTGKTRTAGSVKLSAEAPGKAARRSTLGEHDGN